MKYKNEKEFTKDFLATIDGWHYKIPDDSRGYKPFDILAVVNGRSIAYELKNIKVSLTDNKMIESLEQHQVGSLKKFADAGGEAYAVYYDNINETIVTKSIAEILVLIEKKYGTVK